MAEAWMPMPYRFDIDPAAGLIHEVWTGTVTVQALKELSEAEWRHPDYRAGMDILSDFRAAEVDINFEQMLGYISWLEKSDAINRQAIVVSRELEYGLARMFASLSADIGAWQGLEIFTEIEAARAWLATPRADAAATRAIE